MLLLNDTLIKLSPQLSESCVKTPKLVEQSHPAIYITDLSSNNVHSCIHTTSCIIYNQDSYSRSYIQYSSFMAINWFPLLNTVYVLRSVPKFMKRMKGPDYKDKTVFGVPLIVHVQRYGHPLPISLQLALRFLRSQCLDQVHSLVHICKTDYKVHSKLGQSQSYSKLIKKLDVQPLLRFLRQISHTNPNSVCFSVFLPCMLMS